jgi:hypothetical protein
MADKKSLAEAVAMIRRQKKIVKKSLAGIGREFDVSAKPETKALVSAEGSAVMNPAPLQPLKRKLRLAKPKAEPVPEPVPEPEPIAEPVPVEEKKEEPVNPVKRKLRLAKPKTEAVEQKPAKYRIKRNTMTLFL